MEGSRDMKGSGEVAGQYSDPLYAGQAGMPVSPGPAAEPLPPHANPAPRPAPARAVPSPARGDPVHRTGGRAPAARLSPAGPPAQQLESDATVALAVALAAQQAAKAALRFDHTLARRLLEEASGNPLDALVPARCWLSSNHSAMRKGRRAVGVEVANEAGAEVRVLMHIKGLVNKVAHSTPFPRVKVLSKAKKLDLNHTRR